MPDFSRWLVYGLAATLCLSALHAQQLVVRPGVPPGLPTPMVHPDGLSAALLSGKILSPSVDVQTLPGQPAITLTLTAGASSVAFILTSPTGRQHFTWLSGLPENPAGSVQRTLTFLVGRPPGPERNEAPHGLDASSESGPWSISEIVVVGPSGLMSYKGAQLAGLFPRTTVDVINNGKPIGSSLDRMPPTCGVGEILTPRISAGHQPAYFRARLPVADTQSGVDSVRIYLDNGALGIAYSGFFASAILTTPIKNGTVEASVELGSRSQPGIYNIRGISVCDFAGNCLNTRSPADIKKALGANTFEMTP